VERSWKSQEINGQGMWVLKEKLKMLKQDLKTWNKDVFRHLDTKR